jgi:hypothetical protein
MSRDRSTTQPQRSRWWGLLGPLQLLLYTVVLSPALGYITLPPWMSWARMAAAVLSTVNLIVIGWLIWTSERKAPHVRPHGRAGRHGRWLSVSRCAPGLVAVLWPPVLVRRMRYSATVAERLVAYAVALQPARYREPYQAMWLGELDWLQAQDAPVLGWAIGVAGTAVFTRLELRARLAGAAGRLRALPKSRVARAVRRAKPIWLGVLTAAGVFCAAAAGWSGAGQPDPSRAQLLWAVVAAVLTGGAVTWQTWPRGPAGEEPGSIDEPEREDGP